MTTLVRWNPLQEMMSLRSEMNRLFGRTLEDMSHSEWQTLTSWGLALDVAEDDNAFTVLASVPGINPDDLDITISDNVLTIKGDYQTDEDLEKGKYHIRERRLGSFGRSITLPVPVNADAVDASYDKGVLSLTIPKAEAVRPRRISINTRTIDQP